MEKRWVIYTEILKTICNFPQELAKTSKRGTHGGIIKKVWCLSLYPEIVIPPIAALNGLGQRQLIRKANYIDLESHE